MILSTLIVLFAVAVLIFAIWLAKTRVPAGDILENPSRYLRPVDVEAFRNLIDPAEEQFLRSRLPPADFRSIQRERLSAAVEYIRGAAHNAVILQQVAADARYSSDPAVAQNAERLIGEATRLRLYAYQAIPRLYLAMLFPNRLNSPVRVAESYEQMTRQLVSLGAQYPTRGVSAAL